MYQKNDYLVYGKDVCKVFEITEDNNIKYYLLRPLKDQSLKIKIPTDNEKIRNIMTKEQLNNLILKIKDIEIIEADEKYIELEYKKLLQEPTHEDLIKIIKTTYLRNKKRLDNNIPIDTVLELDPKNAKSVEDAVRIFMRSFVVSSIEKTSQMSSDKFIVFLSQETVTKLVILSVVLLIAFVAISLIVSSIDFSGVFFSFFFNLK